jgi:hypothetical protein
MAGSFSPITTKAAGQPNFRAVPAVTTTAAIRRAAQEDGYRTTNGKGFRPVSAGQKRRCHRGFFG